MGSPQATGAPGPDLRAVSHDSPLTAGTILPPLKSFFPDVLPALLLGPMVGLLEPAGTGCDWPGAAPASPHSALQLCCLCHGVNLIHSLR